MTNHKVVHPSGKQHFFFVALHCGGGGDRGAGDQEKRGAGGVREAGEEGAAS